MDLTTRCPKCDTVFQASLNDLQLRKGYIRCVQCSHIFDGYAEVVSDTSKDPYLDESVADEPEIESTEPDFSFTENEEPEDNSAFSISLDQDNRPAQSEPFIMAPSPDRIRADNSRFSYEELEDSSSFRGLLAWFVLILLVVLMALQGLYIYRAQVAQNFPATRPLLEKYCDLLGCSIPYLRDKDNLVITKSALKIVKPKLANTDSDSTKSQDDSENNSESQDTDNGDDQAVGLKSYELQFNLRNLADQPQEWPTIVLDLKDNSGQVQVRKNLSPTDYLAQTSKPLAANSESFIRLPLQLNDDISINGFQLDLFFP